MEEKIDIKNIGCLIKSSRKERGMTQAEIAGMIGISTQHYSRLERGEYTPGLPTFLKIVEILDLDISKLKIKSENNISTTMYEILQLLEKFNITQQKAVLTFLKTIATA